MVFTQIFEDIRLTNRGFKLFKTILFCYYFFTLPAVYLSGSVPQPRRVLALEDGDHLVRLGTTD